MCIYSVDALFYILLYCNNPSRTGLLRSEGVLEKLSRKTSKNINYCWQVAILYQQKESLKVRSCFIGVFIYGVFYPRTGLDCGMYVITIIMLPLCGERRPSRCTIATIQIVLVASTKLHNCNVLVMF